MSTTWATVRDEMSTSMGDYCHSTVTTALAATTALVDTTLTDVKGGRTADYFNNWWILVTANANIGAVRQVTDYDGAGTFTVNRAYTAEVAGEKATYELHKIDPREKLRAANQAARELYPILHKRLYSDLLVTGNVLPNSHFEDWASASYPDFYRVTTATAAATTTAGLYWGGAKSAKVAATAANGYMSISSDQYPRLLDLMGETVDFYAWAYPEVANDAYLAIYTLKADSTAQTLTSTTTCPAGEWTKLELENQTLNDDLVTVEIRFKVATNAKYAYFDHARLFGVNLYDYLLPTSFQTGQPTSVRIQIADNDADNLGIARYSKSLSGWQTIWDGAYKYLRVPYALTHDYKIELVGEGQLEDTLSADTDTLSLDEPYISTFTAYAVMKLYQNLRNQPSGGTMDLYEMEMLRWSGVYESLSRRIRMPLKPLKIGWGIR